MRFADEAKHERLAKEAEVAKGDGSFGTDGQVHSLDSCEQLFHKISAMKPLLAGKITGMLLEQDDTELMKMLSDKAHLMNRIDEALGVLKRAGEKLTFSEAT